MMGVDLGVVKAILELDSKQFDAAINVAQKNLLNFSKTIGRIGTYMTIGLTTPITLYARKAVKSFAQFDDAIVRAAAVTRGMNADMRREMEKTALQMSRQSLLSATDLAEGYFALGQAGYSAAQSMKILPVVEDFAIASSADLDTSIRYLSRTVEGLGMASEDPIKMMKAMEDVSNAFTFAAITTTAEIEDFAVAMTHAAAPALKLVNKSMIEGTAVLMAFARAGIVAEEAGTLLWTTVRDLQRANIKARSEWERFGLTVYDSDGKMRNMADIFGDIEAKFSGLSDEAKKATLQMLGFQDRSLRGVQALMGFSEEMRVFQNAMDNMGNLTEQVADTYKKSFNAQITMAKNTINSLGIEIGWYLSPIIDALNRKIKDLATWWDTLSDNAKLVVVEIGLVVAIAGPLLIIFSKMLVTITYLSLGFVVVGKAMLAFAGSLGTVIAAAAGWLAIGVAIIAVIYAIRAVWDKASGQVRENLQIIVDDFKLAVELWSQTVGRFWSYWYKGFNMMFDDTLYNFKEFVKDAGALMALSSPFLLGNALANSKGSLSGAFVNERDKIGKVLDSILGSTKKAMGMEGIELETIAAAWGEATKENLVEVGEAIKKQFGDDFAAVTDLITEKVSMMNANFLEFLPSKDLQEVVTALEKVKKEFKDLDKNIQVPIDRWSQFLDSAANEAERWVDFSMQAFDSVADYFTDVVMGMETSWKDFMKVMVSEFIKMRIKIAMAQLAMDWDSENSIIKTFLRSAVNALFPGPKTSVNLGGAGSLTGRNITNTSGAWAGMEGSIGSFSALGDVFNLGKIIPMAMGSLVNSIVNSPTLAPMANGNTALMGEAGPEGVLPLKRDANGRLGVIATQPNVSVENRLKIINVMSKEEQLAAMQSDAGEKVIMNILRRNGVI